MPTQFDSYGFEVLRGLVQSNIPFVAVVDDTGTEVLRWDVPNNGSASWASGPGTNPLAAELVITGQDIIDAGGSLPVTLVRTEAYESSAATTRVNHDTIRGDSGDPAPATLEVAEDTLTITHNHRLPP